MPKFRCLKGYWDFPVEVETSQDAQVIFRCSECVMNDSHCFGWIEALHSTVGKMPSPPFSEEEKEARVVSALELLAQARPKKTGRARRNLRGYVAAYYDEILPARNAGHGFPTIAQVMTENGVVISQTRLQEYFNDIWRANERT